MMLWQPSVILEHLEQMTLDFFQLQLQMQHLAQPKPYNPQGRHRLVESPPHSPADDDHFHEQNHDHPALLTKQ
jgi:hypothetical protein